MEWKDTTSYRRDGDKIPHWWSTTIGSIRVSVGNNHLYYRDGNTWLMHCAPWFDTYVLKAKNEQDAKQEAMTLVCEKCKEIIAALGLN